MNSKEFICLYKSILKQHKKLPPAMKFLGDQYVKAEFKAHKNNTDPKYTIGFMNEWKRYLKVLEENGEEGKKLDEVELDKFSNEQIGQLHVLKTEAKLLRTDEDVNRENDDEQKKK